MILPVATAPARSRDVPARPAAVPLDELVHCRRSVPRQHLHIFLVDDTEPDQNHAVQQIDRRSERDEEGKNNGLDRIVQGSCRHGTYTLRQYELRPTTEKRWDETNGCLERNCEY